MQQQPKILYISYDGLTDQLGQSQILPYLQGLSAKGYHITIVSCEKQEAYQKHKAAVNKVIKDAQITWHFVYYSNKYPVLSAYLNTQRITNLCFKLSLANNYAIAHCRSYLAAMIGLRLKKRFGCRLLFDMRGFWPDERVDGRLWNLRNPVYKMVYRFFKQQEIKLLQQADHVVSLTHKAKEIILSWQSVSILEEKITVIPCCSDSKHFDYTNSTIASKEATRQQLNIKNEELVITYIGSVGTWYMLPEMLDFFNLLRKTHSNSRFLFITNEHPNIVKILAQQKNIALNKISTVAASRTEVPSLLSISNVALFFIKPSFSKQASSPTKLAELMCMGVPIIANTDIGDVDSIINESKGGFLVSSFTETAYKEAIQNIPDLLNSDKKAIREYAIHHFSIEQGVLKYDSIYKSMMVI